MRECRDLSTQDLGWIVQELRKLPTQSKQYADVPDDPAWVEAYFQSMYNTGALMGSVHWDTASFLLAAVMRPWYADRLEVHEMILWVPEEHRGGRTAIRLIEHFTVAARRLQPYSIHVGASLDITSADKTLRLYELCGYTRDHSGAVMRL